MSVFELEECSLHVNRVEIDKDVNNYQYTLLVFGITIKNGQSKREQTCGWYFCQELGPWLIQVLRMFHTKDPGIFINQK